MILINSETRFADSNDVIVCIDEEREALLTFQRSPMDESGVSSSWGPENEKRDCCKWSVNCSNRTGHVIELILSPMSDSSVEVRL